MLGFFGKLKEGLTKTSKSFAGNLAEVLTSRKLDEATLSSLEDALLMADVGVTASASLTDRLKKEKFGKDITETELKTFLSSQIAELLAGVEHPLIIDPTKKPFVILTVGVNGSGKTTFIGKLAGKLKSDGLKATLVAGDTFRAAAIEQLKVWGERTSTPVISSKIGADAAGLIFDALLESKKRGDDVLIIDTAGRLQNKTNLMAELEKIIKVIKKVDPSAPHARLLVLDAGVGQNALSQVEAFHHTADLTGLVLTKLDGTAKGGIIVSLAERFNLPINYIGTGEGKDDFSPFIAKDYSDILMGLR